MRDTIQHAIYTAGAAPRPTIPYVTAGVVVDTNDPYQQGRVRVICATLNESSQTALKDIPWALYVTPFGGYTNAGTRGPGIQSSTGSINYGFWAPPKIGAQVIVMFVDGDPNMRIVLGCVNDLFKTHTMPHGRWMYEDHPVLEKVNNNEPKPYGPYTSEEFYIQPTADNLRKAFGNKPEPNYEWRTRAADYTVSSVDLAFLDSTVSSVPDDKDVKWDNWVSRQGYQVNRVSPNVDALYNEGNLDNNVYCFVSPGFHAFSMDDRQENCRIRLRTTSGHQILMDDTNERIYISTAEGNNWIEMDQQGNIDIFTTNKVNIRAKKDINLTSDETIRLHGAKGVHIYSGDEMRLEAQKDVHARFKQNFRMNVGISTFILSGQNINLRANQDMCLEAAQTLNQYGKSELKLTSGVATHINGGANIYQTAGKIDLNGPDAAIASSAELPAEQPAMWTNRVPDHEPWGRTMTINDFTHAPEFPYTSPNVNKIERGISITRGKFWRR
jgi:phage gp45-like